MTPPSCLILLQDVFKTYDLFDRPAERILNALPLRPVSRVKQFQALSGVNLAIPDGESFALIGANGCGKSTLLQIVAGILQPSSGRVHVDGRVAALLELGAGFNPDFTGRENARLASELLGQSRSAIELSLPSIEQFAEIGPFIDRPVREFSTGMYVRLAFAVAIHAEPDVLIVDEALAVGDVRFANRCIRRIEEIKARGTTLLFVSHDLGMVKRLADRAGYLEQGRLICVGDPVSVSNRYVAAVLDPVTLSIEELQSGHGDGSSRIRDIALLDSAGGRVQSVRSGDLLSLRLTIEFIRPVESPMVGLLIRNRLGVDIYGTNTKIAGVDLGAFATGQILSVIFRFCCRLTRQSYSITVATQHPNGMSQDWRDDILSFDVIDSRDLAGVADLGAEVTVERC